MKVSRLPSCATFVIAAVVLFLFSCSLTKTTGFVTHTLKTGGEERTTPVETPASPTGPRMIIFALDGAVPAGMLQGMKALQMPHIKELLGKDEGDGLFEHGYAV